MIPFTTCMKFNRKRLNRGGINKPQHLLLVQPNQQRSTSLSPSTINQPTSSTTTEVTTSAVTSTEIQNVPPFLQCPENRLLLTLRRAKTAQRSIHIDPIALLDYSYHGITDRFLENLSNWSFNSFTLDTLTGGHPLPSLLFHLFNKYNFIQEFKLEIVNVWKCFRLFETGYHDTNPYHNSVHAADVTQAMHCFIEEEKIGQHLTPMEKMCSLLAAVAHDLDHPGVNQHFLIATKSHLASLYNNLSVLESHHWRFAMSCLKESGIFSHFNDDQWSTVQFLLRSLILATDVTQQANYLKRFRESLENGTISMTSPTDRLFIMQIALKCADLGNPCRPWTLSKKWTTQICNEFYRQGDYERQLKMKVTPIFDRRTASVARIQTDFYRNIVSPLFQLWDQFLCSKLSRRMMLNLQFNDSQWTNSLQKVNVKRRHSYETMNEKKRKAKDISKSLDDIMLIEEISLDELKEMPKGIVLQDKQSTSSATSSPSSSASGRHELEGTRKDSTGEDNIEEPTDRDHHHQDDGDHNHHHYQHDERNVDDEGDRMHIGKKQCIGPNGCGTPSPPRTKEKRCSLPTIKINQPTSQQTSSLSLSLTTIAAVKSSSSPASSVYQSQSVSHQQSTSTPTKQPPSCSSIPHHSHHPHHHHSRRHHHHHHHHHPHYHRQQKQQQQQQQPSTQPSQPYISVSEPITQTDCTYTDRGDDHGYGGVEGGGVGPSCLPDSSIYSTYSGLPLVVEQLMNYEQSIDEVTCLPHSFSTLPGYPTSPSTLAHSSYPSQSIVDTAQYLRGRRGSAPGCIDIYTGRELAAAALVLLHGTVSESEDNRLLSSSSSSPRPHHQHRPSLFHSSYSSSSLIHLKCHPSSTNPSPVSSSQSSPSSSPPHQTQQYQPSCSSPSTSSPASAAATTTVKQQRPSLFLTRNSDSNTNITSISGNNENEFNINVGQKRRSSFPAVDSGHYFGFLTPESAGPGSFGVGMGGVGGKLSNRKSPSSYLHGTAKSCSPRLKGRSLELVMSSLTAKTKLLTNQSCSLDSASECRSWIKREERRGSIPQDILITSLANYSSANAV